MFPAGSSSGRTSLLLDCRAPLFSGVLPIKQKLTEVWHPAAGGKEQVQEP